MATLTYLQDCLCNTIRRISVCCPWSAVHFANPSISLTLRVLVRGFYGDIREESGVSTTNTWQARICSLVLPPTLLAPLFCRRPHLKPSFPVRSFAMSAGATAPETSEPVADLVA